MAVTKPGTARETGHDGGTGEAHRPSRREPRGPTSDRRQTAMHEAGINGCFPGPSPRHRARRPALLSDAGMRRLLDAAAAAGLLAPDADYPANRIADAGTSFFTLTADGCTHLISAYALQEGMSTQGLDQRTIDARAKLLAFTQQLADL